METHEEGYDTTVWSQMGNQLGLPGPGHPWGVRRLGLLVPIELVARPRGGWAAPCCARPTTPRRCWRPTLCCRAMTTPPRRSCLPGHRLGRDDRHAGLHRGQRPLQPRQRLHHPRGQQEERRLRAVGLEELRHRRPHGQLDPRGRSHGQGHISLFVVEGDAAGLARRPCRHGPNAQAGQARVLQPRPAARRRGPVEALSPVLDLASRLPAEHVGGAQRCSTWPSSTPRCACSSAARSARSRPSSTSAPTCCSRSSRPSRRRTTAVCASAEERRAALGGLARQGLQPRRTSMPRPRTSRSTAASASPGSTTRTCTSAGQVERAAPRRPVVPPRAAGPAHRHLSPLMAGSSSAR